MIFPASLPRASEPHFPTKSASPPAEGSLASPDAPPGITSSRQRASLPGEASLASADALRRLASNFSSVF